MKFRIFYSIFLFPFFFSCADQYEPDHFAFVQTSVTNVTSEGAQFNGKVQVVGNSTIVETGFEVSENYINRQFSVKAPNIQQGNFSLLLTSSLRSNNQYNIRAYARTADSFTIYGNLVSFISKGSKAPVISDFTPTVGRANDVIVINGDNFGLAPSENFVSFNGYGSNAIVEEASKTQLKIRCPAHIGTGNFRIYIEVGDYTVHSTEYFTLVP